MTYRAPLSLRECLLNFLLNFGVRWPWLRIGIGPGQRLAIASNEGGLCAACGDLRNPMMDGGGIVQIRGMRARHARKGGELFETRLLRLVSHRPPGVKISGG